MPHPQVSLNRILALQLLVALIWGGTWIAGRLVATELTPLAAAGWRFVFASLTLGVLVYRSEGRLLRPARTDLRRILLLGATGIFLYNLCFFYGLRHLQAGRGALVVALNPVAVTLAAWALGGEPMSPRRALGVTVALLGCLTVIGHGDPLALLRGRLGVGEAYILGCVAAWAAYTLLGRQATCTLSPLAMTFYASSAGGVLLIALGLIKGDLLRWPAFSAAAWGGLFYLGVLGSGFSYVWYAQGVQALGATRAAVFINLVPVCAVLLGAGFLGEHIGWLSICGGALVLAGVTITVSAARVRRLE